MCERTGKFVLLRQTCGPARAVPVDCGDPFCQYCEPMRARAIRERWGPVIGRMRYPVILTPTLRDGTDLRDRIKFYQESFRRFLDLRLGPRNRPVFLAEAREFVLAHLKQLVDKGEISTAEAETRQEKLFRSLDRFDLRLSRKESPRLRDITGEGVALFEFTFDGDWHPHRHIVLDTEFIPWPYLVVTWKRATKGEGEVIDIRHIGKTDKDLKEAFKYITKFWEIPEEKRGEFRDSIKGLKRVWPLGGAKPDQVDKPCPFCGEVGCRPHLVGMGESATRQKVRGLDVLKVGTSDNPGDYQAQWFYLDDKRTWREMQPEVVDLILREIACHSQPAPPKQIALSGWASSAAG